MVQGLFRGAQPLVMGEWVGRMGLSEPAPVGPTGWGAWARRARIDLAALHCGEIACLKGLQGARGYPG